MPAAGRHGLFFPPKLPAESVASFLGEPMVVNCIPLNRTSARKNSKAANSGTAEEKIKTEHHKTQPEGKEEEGNVCSEVKKQSGNCIDAHDSNSGYGRCGIPPANDLPDLSQPAIEEKMYPPHCHPSNNQRHDKKKPVHSVLRKNDYG
jgi:hypothetical protein